MTTGKKFRYLGLGPSERMNRLRKEIDLIALEHSSHREMLVKLRYLQEWVRLTAAQQRDVEAEVRWRKATISDLVKAKRNKVLCLQQWNMRLDSARQRTTEAMA